MGPTDNIIVVDFYHVETSSYTTTEQVIYPGWETLFVPVSKPGTPGRNRDKNHPFVPVGNTGWEILFVLVSQPGTPGRDKRGCPFVPGLANGIKNTLLSRLVTPTGTKGAASATCLAHSFVPVGVTNRDKRSIFFLFLFSQFFFYFK